MYKTSVILLALSAMSAIGAAQQVRIYQDGRPERIFKPVSGLDGQDVKFLRQAAIADRFEIEASKMGLQSSDPFTHEYAKEMIDDHQAALTEAVQIAQERGITLDSDLPKKLQHQLNVLRTLNGDGFDQAFREAQKKGHEATIQVFKREIENGHDQSVKALAVKQLPTIEVHYKMALMKKTMMGPTKMEHGT